MPFIHPILHTLFKPRWSSVILTDLRSDTANQTTYTFTNCQLNLGAAGHVPSDAYVDTALLRSMTRVMTMVIVHGEDSQTIFGVTDCTIGGVSGSEQVDRGGATNAINTAIYTWRSSLLAGIANTDIAVTFTEAVTSCAIGVLAIYNTGIGTGIAANALTGTGVIRPQPNCSITAGDGMGGAVIIGATCATGGGTEIADFFVEGAGGNFQPTMLYQGNNAELDFAAAWAPMSHWYGGNGVAAASISTSFSGTGAGDAATIVLL